MIQYVTRQTKRFAVLLPGLVIVYFSVRNVYPYFHRLVPISLAILITYVLAAYVFIPAVIRLFRMIIPADHLPLYCVTPDGFASDPLNIGVIGTRRELITAMEKAGWYMADRHNIHNLFRMVGATLFGQVYRHAPVSSMYLFGRKQDVAFEIPIENSPGQRHHVRFWATTYEKKKRLSVHSIAWHHRREHVFGDNLLWVGAASLDTGINLIRHNLQVTHMIAPDTDSERELITKQLRSAGMVASVDAIKLDNPYRLINRVWRGYLQTDGTMSVVTLKRIPTGQRQV
jgi:hypothetical protein